MPVKQVSTQAEFEQLKTSSALLIVDFFATWCGPCRVISPKFEQLSNKQENSAATFVKIDVDQLKAVSRDCEVTAMPTFMFFAKGQKLDEIKGADPHQLESKIKQHVGGLASKNTETQFVKGMSSVNDKIDMRQLELLNAEDGSNARELFDTKSKALISSDSDEQLMLYIPFQESLKIHTIVIQAARESTDEAPNSITLYVNRPTILSFDDVDNVPATQTIAASEIKYDEQGRAVIPLRFVKFQRCNSLVIFIGGNQTQSDVTRLQGIELIGDVCAANSSGVVQKLEHEH